MSSFGSRIFSKVQSVEKEIKDLYLKFTVGSPTAATASLAVTAPITLTASATGTGRNTNTFTTQVIAAAANPTDTVLATFSGTAAAIVCTVTPNSGANNIAAPLGAATATLATTVPIVLTSVALGTGRNTNTLTTEIVAAAANPTDTVLAVFTGTANAIVCTVTPNNGVNNPASTAATASIATTTPIELTSVVKGTVRNTNTFTVQVLAAAANPTDTVIAEFTGTAAAIVCTITPNDGTNNTATPVAMTTAQLREMITTGAVAAYTGSGAGTLTLTDASGFRNDQTATGGDGTALADAGEGDGLVATFAAGADLPVDLTTAELVELINSGVVVGKTVTLTDASALRNDQTATGGGPTALANSGEGDSLVATFTGGTNSPVAMTTAQLRELITTGAIAAYTGSGVGTLTLTDASSLRALQTATGGGATALADAGEGDAVVATFTGGDGEVPAIVKGIGFSSIARNSAGDYTITLSDKYSSLKHLRATVLSATAVDARVQIHSYDLTAKTVRIMVLTGSVKTDLADGTPIILQMDVKNSGQPD